MEFIERVRRLKALCHLIKQKQGMRKYSDKDLFLAFYVQEPTFWIQDHFIIDFSWQKTTRNKKSISELNDSVYMYTPPFVFLCFMHYPVLICPCFSALCTIQS